MSYPALEARSHPHTIRTSVFAMGGGGSSVVGGPQNFLSKQYHLAVYLAIRRHWWFKELSVDASGKVTVGIIIVHQVLAVDPRVAVDWTFTAVRAKSSAHFDDSCNDRVVQLSTRHRVDGYLANESSICMANQDVVETPRIAFEGNIGGLLAALGGTKEHVRDCHTRIYNGTDEAFALVLQSVSCVRSFHLSVFQVSTPIYLPSMVVFIH